MQAYTRVDFLSLSLDQQFVYIRSIFADIQNKNLHCRDIYMVMQEHPGRFDTGLLLTLYDEIQKIIDRTTAQQMHIYAQDMHTIKEKLSLIAIQEASMSADADEILNQIF